MKRLIVTIAYILLFSGCSAMKPKANGSHFNFGSNNNSEASIWLEKIVVDNKWNAPSTGTLGCSGENVNGALGTSSLPYSTPAPRDTIYLEWYSWKEKARMKATVQLPGGDVITSLLLNPPWYRNKQSVKKSYFIIDFRPNHKVWIKLAKSVYPKTEEEIMILAEGQGVETDDIVTRYSGYKEGDDYSLDCIEMRDERQELGYYSSNLKVFDKWYTEFFVRKENKNE